ncbi:MAG: hypothetical protein EXR72_08590 [Myxococcales bacterium]|nr:hypothetical protein [Myxococcales bacterium]
MATLAMLAAPDAYADRVPAEGRGGLPWWRANFHAHAANSAVSDDGAEAPSVLHALLAARGFHFSVHSPHSTLAGGSDAAAAWRKQLSVEAALSRSGFTAVCGQELTVAPGPAFRSRTELLGREAPGNLDHLSLVGGDAFVPDGTAMAVACRRVHDGGGICLVNHPGPGPMMWEEGLWEAPENRAAVDGIEVYNGQALAAAGIEFEARYLQATAYRGLGLQIAAVTGADTHGPGSVERARARLPRAVRALAAVAAGDGPSGRPELAAATLVEAPSPSLPAVIAAVKARRTVATWRLADLPIECPGMGAVHRTAAVRVRLGLGRPVGEVTLYREGEAVRTWQGVAQVEWSEEITARTAYVFAVRDGIGRLLTSAIWFDPPARDR